VERDTSASYLDCPNALRATVAQGSLGAVAGTDVTPYVIAGSFTVGTGIITGAVACLVARITGKSAREQAERVHRRQVDSEERQAQRDDAEKKLQLERDAVIDVVIQVDRYVLKAISTPLTKESTSIADAHAATAAWARLHAVGSRDIVVSARAYVDSWHAFASAAEKGLTNEALRVAYIDSRQALWNVLREKLNLEALESGL
jgi:hypothetical protein